MIQNSEELKQRIKEKLDSKPEEFMDGLNISKEDFTIDTIEDMMSRFHKETNQIMIDSINEAITFFDELNIIDKKTRD